MIFRLYYKELSHFIYTVAIFTLLYTPISVYRINYCLTAVIVTVTIHQLFAPTKTKVEENEIEKTETEKKFEQYKEKLA